MSDDRHSSRNLLGEVDKAGGPGRCEAVESNNPLVSVILPTCDRRTFVPQAIRYYLRQDYPNKFMIVIDDGADAVKDLIPETPGFRYVRLDNKVSLGTKRNLGCSLANGEIVMFWDDDDWYGSGRITHQVLPIANGGADITCLEDCLFFSMDSRQFWACDRKLQSKMFELSVCGGTMALRRSVWQESRKFPDSSVGEEAVFLLQVVTEGARLARLGSDNVFFYVRHGNNSWRFEAGEYLDSRSWRRVSPPEFVPQDDLFYYGIID